MLLSCDSGSCNVFSVLPSHCRFLYWYLLFLLTHLFSVQQLSRGQTVVTTSNNLELNFVVQMFDGDQQGRQTGLIWRNSTILNGVELMLHPFDLDLLKGYKTPTNKYLSDEKWFMS